LSGEWKPWRSGSFTGNELLRENEAVCFIDCMIAEIIPDAYDVAGRKVFRPDLRRKAVRPTFPIGRYFSQPLTIRCERVADVRRFLSRCKYVSDKEQFDRDDYWQPPEQFERSKQGDCDDFALWTWRELLDLGYEARFVLGRAGRYGEGHAWVQFSENGKDFLVEPQYWPVGESMPRLSGVRYCPRWSVIWDGKNASWYSHEERKWHPRIVELFPLAVEWITFWGRYWTRIAVRIPWFVVKRLWSRKAPKIVDDQSSSHQ
jgi:hypothetical protein